MARQKKVITNEVEAVSTVKKVDTINTEFAQLLEAYKVQNPIKYELKKEELLKKLNK
jgi:hypothetical protein